ncbi:MAG: cupin domain-containing protein, partial [Firmicutes bacterium]|nr:cupin domain-containing protein [Bacillota bacterium]
MSQEDYYQDVREHHLEPLWTIGDWFLSNEPLRVYRPYQWHWSDVYPRLMAAADHMVPGQGGARRVLVYAHPDLTQTLGTTHTLNVAMQMILPGEEAPAHRHTPLAIRFIITGQGASTTVNGERMAMGSGDFLVTPRWAWHDHRHEGEGPMVWMDGLDIPLTRWMGGMFVEPYSASMQEESVPSQQSAKVFGTAGIYPKVSEDFKTANGSLMVYPWEATRKALEAVREVALNPFDGAIVEYRNPRSGGPVLPSLGATMQSLQPRETTKTHRHTSSVAYYVFRGEGCTDIDGQMYDWSQGDVIVIPPWHCRILC